MCPRARVRLTGQTLRSPTMIVARAPAEQLAACGGCSGVERHGEIRSKALLQEP